LNQVVAIEKVREARGELLRKQGESRVVETGSQEESSREREVERQRWESERNERKVEEDSERRQEESERQNKGERMLGTTFA
jgi:hypothetical protein